MKGSTKITGTSQKALCLIALGAMIANCSTAAFAQAPPEVLEKARRLGISRDMKVPPEWFSAAGIHYSNQVPVNFPISAYTSNVTRTSFMNAVKGPASGTQSISTKDSPATVYQFYLSALRSGNWAVQAPSAEALAKMGPPGSIYMLQGTRKGEYVTINILAVPGQPGSNFTVTWVACR